MNIRHKTKARYKLLIYSYIHTVGNGLGGVGRNVGGVWRGVWGVGRVVWGAWRRIGGVGIDEGV